MNKLMFLAFDCVKDCGGADILKILKFVFKLLDLVLFIVPMGLIIMVILDFSKNVIAGKEDEMKKNVDVAIKRIIYCMVIFLVPTIVNFAVNFVSGTGDNIAAKASYCIDYAKTGKLSKCEPYNCYLCVESGVGKKEYSYVWGKTTQENCFPVNDYLSENACINKNNTIEYCFYCDDTNDYYYGIEPEKACSSSWKKDYSKGKESCKFNGSTNEESQKYYCYVCSDAGGLKKNEWQYKWSQTKPTSPCMFSNGWQIDYTINLAHYCILK